MEKPQVHIYDRNPLDAAIAMRALLKNGYRATTHSFADFAVAKGEVVVCGDVPIAELFDIHARVNEADARLVVAAAGHAVLHHALVSPNVCALTKSFKAEELVELVDVVVDATIPLHVDQNEKLGRVA